MDMADEYDGGDNVSEVNTADGDTKLMIADVWS